MPNSTNWGATTPNSTNYKTGYILPTGVLYNGAGRSYNGVEQSSGSRNKTYNGVLTSDQQSTVTNPTNWAAV